MFIIYIPQNTYWARLQAIFILSGDKELVEISDKSRILYKEYHNYYRQSLMTGSVAWMDSVYTFFNNSLFATSSSVVVLGLNFIDATSGPQDTWKEDFECAMEMGGDLPDVDAPQAASPLTKEGAPVSTVSLAKAAPILTPTSISAAM